MLHKNEHILHAHFDYKYALQRSYTCKQFSGLEYKRCWRSHTVVARGRAPSYVAKISNQHRPVLQEEQLAERPRGRQGNCHHRSECRSRQTVSTRPCCPRSVDLEPDTSICGKITSSKTDHCFTSDDFFRVQAPRCTCWVGARSVQKQLPHVRRSPGT